jgi:hypothetical protein
VGLCNVLLCWCPPLLLHLGLPLGLPDFVGGSLGRHSHFDGELVALDSQHGGVEQESVHLSQFLARVLQHLILLSVLLLSGQLFGQPLLSPRHLHDSVSNQILLAELELLGSHSLGRHGRHLVHELSRSRVQIVGRLGSLGSQGQLGHPPSHTGRSHGSKHCGLVCGVVWCCTDQVFFQLAEGDMQRP